MKSGYITVGSAKYKGKITIATGLSTINSINLTVRGNTDTTDGSYMERFRPPVITKITGGTVEVSYEGGSGNQYYLGFYWLAFGS